MVEKSQGFVINSDTDTDKLSDNRWIGIWIRHKRLEKNWSQDGLCKGICAVSYLSKIEQGKVSPSPEVLHALGKRLDDNWDDSTNSREKWVPLIEEAYELLYDHSNKDFKRLKDIFKNCSTQEQDIYSPCWLDFQLLSCWYADQEMTAKASLLSPFESVMVPRQHTLYLILTDCEEKALQLYPSTETLIRMGLAEYGRGNYTRALEYLTIGNSRASEDGKLYLMLNARIIIANSYSNLHDFPQMNRHMNAALKMANALGEEELAETIRYNYASTCLETNRIEEAYMYLSALKKETPLILHKLSIACEKLGRKDEALAILDRVNLFPEESKKKYPAQMFDLVRYRLTHTDYLMQQEYGDMLLQTFSYMREHLSAGYAEFHLPWMLEWLKAKRMYKESTQLLLDFPYYR